MSATGTICTCPSCGWVGPALMDGDDGEACPKCGYNGETVGTGTVTITLTQDQAEHTLLCARMALAQAQLAGLEGDREPSAAILKRRDTFAELVLALEAQITERA